MKKSIFILASLYLLLLSNPLFAQLEEPGDDPLTTPIDDYIWILALIGLALVFLKFRAIHKRAGSSLQ